MVVNCGTEPGTVNFVVTLEVVDVEMIGELAQDIFGYSVASG